MKELLRKLKRFNLPESKFAIFGSGPLGVRGLRQIRDLDVIVTNDLWAELSAKFPVEDLGTHKRITLGNIEVLSKPVLDFSAEDLIAEADVIKGTRFVTLERTLEWKKKMGRKKDIEDVNLIEKYLERNG